MANLSQRLRRLENDVDARLSKEAFVAVRYTNGDTESKRFLPYLFYVYSLYTAGRTLPEVDKVSFIFDTAKQGRLPELLLYMLSK